MDHRKAARARDAMPSPSLFWSVPVRRPRTMSGRDRSFIGVCRTGAAYWLTRVARFGARKDSALDREAAKLRDCALRTTSLVTVESYVLQTHSAMFYSVRSRVN